VLQALRLLVFAAVAAVAAGALAAMAVQRRIVSPFGHPARLVRRLTDPMLRPFEQRLIRSGGNPQSAPWWLLGTALVLGIVGLTAAEWVVREALLLEAATAGGPRLLALVLLDWAFSLLMIALLLRVIASWFRVSPYARWMRPVVLATEWLLAPLRRVLPALGPFDLSPLVAWFLLSVLRGALGRLL
jgi:YggT family protein